MKLGLIVPGFSADETDWCIPVLRHLVDRLARRHEVHVFALRYPPRRAAYDVFGARVRSFGGGGAGGMRRGVLLARVLTAMAVEHSRGRFDALHGLWADEPGWLAVTAGQRLGIPAVVSLMGGELVGLKDIGYGVQLHRTGRWLVRSSLRRGATVTVGSGFLGRLARDYGVGSHLVELPLGVDLDLFRPGGDDGDRQTAPDGTTRLLNVGSLTPIKDQATLIGAMERVRDRLPGAHLHIVGEGPCRAALAQQVARLGLERHATLHGAVPHEELPTWYRSADLCVLSSRYESQAMVVLEAAACGRATVGTAVGLVPELAPASLIVPVGNPEALAQALLCVLEEPQAPRRLGAAALETTRSRYRIEQTIERLEQLYRSA